MCSLVSKNGQAKIVCSNCMHTKLNSNVKVMNEKYQVYEETFAFSFVVCAVKSKLQWKIKYDQKNVCNPSLLNIMM